MLYRAERLVVITQLLLPHHTRLITLTKLIGTMFNREKKINILWRLKKPGEKLLNYLIHSQDCIAFRANQL